MAHLMRRLREAIGEGRYAEEAEALLSGRAPYVDAPYDDA
jgi:hypothetical protein